MEESPLKANVKTRFRRIFKIEAVKTGYWTPGEDYLEKISEALKNRVADGDIVVVSEKAISVARGFIVDEGKIKPGLLASAIARIWMRIVWGYFLGRACRLMAKNIERLRNYPLKEGGAHKEVALRYAGFLHALMWGSEGGIDGSNLPYAYVSLPIKNPEEAAEEIRRYLKVKLNRNIAVMIIDSDKTYSLGRFHFTHRPKPLKGIHTLFGFVAYVIGRFLKLRRRSTPLALTGAKMNIDLALEIAELADKTMGSGSGRTVWDMAEKFHVGLTGVTWGMLRKMEHKPIVIVKLCNYEHQKINYSIL
ncbi:coenzyme F420-0:L-glutamate ligase [Candidatus Bathyarchaeota archaeon]|nr:coenzyme F420-0:L-glutamate ligase [Candidatus Bathyarchaeota archaeon]